MKVNTKLHSVALASATLILYLILISSAASAATEQSDSLAGPYAYITNNWNNTVSVINTATDTVTATVPVGSGPDGIAVNPAGKVYVTNSDSNTVSVIDTATNTVTSTVPVGSSPDGVAVNSAGTKVYVTNANSDTVSVIDTATNEVTATVPVGSYPWGVAVNPDGTNVYVVNYDSNTVSVIDAATNKVTATVSVGGYPSGVAVNPTGTKVYVTSDYNVSVIDTATNEVTANVPVESLSWEAAVTPDGTKVYVTNSDSNTVSVIDAATNTVIATIPVGSGPEGITVNPDGTKIYVANYYSGTISVINTTNSVTATINVGYYPVAFGQFIGSVPVPEPVLPVANFTSNVTYGYAPLSVQFTDLSENATEWNWNFGDGATSTDENPMHSFSATGNYTVNLTVSNENGTDSKLATINVSEEPVFPVANFSANPTSGIAPLIVVFTDKSTNKPTKWQWTFGDGATSSKQNPIHKYSRAGNYTVALTVSSAAGNNTTTKTNYIKVVEKPVAEFSASPTSGIAPLIVAFTDKSTGSPTSWQWTFGDGATSSKQNPIHKYSKAGKYTVNLTVKNTKGSNIKTIENYITVKTAPIKPVAAFSASPTSGKAPLIVTFTDKSTNKPTKWQWTFGDGATSSKQNPIHKYSKAGNYTVALTVSNAAGSNTTIKTNYITVVEK